MAGTDRTARADLTRERVIAEAGRFHFFQLAELLSQEGQRAASSFTTSMEEEPVRFRATASIAFPSRDVVSLEQNEDGRWLLTTSFLGLHGSQSPLPGYYLDDLAWEEAQQTPCLTDFFDLFNHRLLLLLHRAWRKYRYYICFKDEGKDEFSARMFALVGLGNTKVREQLQINHSKMLAYAGLLASPGRSPDVICGLVSHCFELDNVLLHSWQRRQVNIASRQQNRLGLTQRLSGKRPEGRTLLGKNFSIGARVPDYSGKFELYIKGLTRQRFLDFLPNGDSYLPLVMFMSFILRDQFAWDLRLGIAPEQVGGMTLGVKQSAQLGWTCFLGRPAEQPEVTISVRE